MKTNNVPDYRPDNFQTHISLPHLSGEQAWAIAEVLDCLCRALWYTHGNAMADFQGRVHPDLDPSDFPGHWCMSRRRTHNDQDDF